MDALDIHYDKFEEVFMGRLNEYAPMKEKIVRANNASFMNKILSKAVMTRSRLHNKYCRRRQTREITKNIAIIV